MIRKYDAELKTTWWRWNAAQALSFGVPFLITAICVHVLLSPPERRWNIWAGVVGFLISQILIGLFTKKNCTLRLYKGYMFLGEASGVPVRDVDLGFSRRDGWLLTLFGLRNLYGKDGRRRITVSRLWYSRRELASFLAQCQAAVTSG